MPNFLKVILALIISVLIYSGYIYLFNNAQFSIAQPADWILSLSIILTLSLIVFFLLNLKSHPLVLAQNRVKRLRDNLFEELYINRESQERVRWILELEQRRDEIRSQIKQNLRLRPRMEAVINEIIDKSWDELIAVIKSGISSLPSNTETFTGCDLDLTAVQKIIEKPQTSDKAETICETEELEELEAVDVSIDAEKPEELETAGDVENPEEILEPVETETIEEAKEPAETEVIEETKEFEEAEEMEEDGEIEEVDDIKTDETFEYEVEEIEIKKDPQQNQYVKNEEKDYFNEINFFFLNTEEKADFDENNKIEEIFAIEEPEELEEAVEIEEVEITVEDYEIDEHTPVLNDFTDSESGDDELKSEDKSCLAPKSLLSLASKIEFNRSVKVIDDEEQTPVNLPDNLEIVSPFTDMFSSLDKNNTINKNKKEK